MKMINRQIGKVTLLVKDYDEAIKWYMDKLNFKLIEDKPLPEQGGKRWVTIAPDSYSKCLDKFIFLFDRINKIDKML